MKRAILAIVAGWVVLAGVTVAVVAEEAAVPAAAPAAVAPAAAAPAPQQAPAPGKQGMGAHRFGKGEGFGKGQRFGAGRRQFGARPQATEQLRSTPEGKAEVERFQKALEGLKADRKTLHEAIQADIKAGKTPADAFTAHADAIKALFKKRILMGIDHRQKMLAIAQQNVDKGVDKAFENFRTRAIERRHKFGQFRQRHQQQQPAKPAQPQAPQALPQPAQPPQQM